MQTIVLSTLNGYQFEELCAKLLLHAFDSATKTQNSNDFGKDIIAYKNNRKYVIECKHYISGGSVGRPAIQKLHSAMIHEDTNYGIIITTGKLAQNAINYINDLVSKDFYIEIMTLHNLVMLAKKSNINLVVNQVENTITSKTITYKILPILTQNSLIAWYISEAKKILNTNIKISDHIHVKAIKHERIGLCKGTNTSGLGMCHTINKSGRLTFLDTQLCAKFNFLNNNENFTVKTSEISDINNLCIQSPLNSSNGFQMIMLNQYEILLELLDINYNIKGFIYSHGGSILSKGIEFTSVYSNKRIKQGTICELCYKIINTDNSLGEHYQCDKCKLNLCFNHAYYKKNIFLEGFFCEKCAQNNLVPVSQKTTYKKRLSRLNKLNSSILLILIGLTITVLSHLFIHSPYAN